MAIGPVTSDGTDDGMDIIPLTRILRSTKTDDRQYVLVIYDALSCAEHSIVNASFVFDVTYNFVSAPL